MTNDRTEMDRSAFGPTAHNAWTRRGDTVRLARAPRTPRTVAMDAQPDRIEFDLSASALVIVDMQNDFCHAEGWFAGKGVPLGGIRAPIPAIARLLEPWREAGAPVIWLNWGIRPDLLNLPPTVLFKGRRTLEGIGYGECGPNEKGPSLVAGGWGAAVIDDLPVAPSDITVLKHRLSGFWDNELDSVLRGLRIDTLFFAGVNTDRCVFSTLQDAGFLGYDCVLLEDACGTPSPEYVSQAIHFLVRQLHGFVGSTDALIDALATTPPTTTP